MSLQSPLHVANIIYTMHVDLNINLIFRINSAVVSHLQFGLAIKSAIPFNDLLCKGSLFGLFQNMVDNDRLITTEPIVANVRSGTRNPDLAEI